MAAKKTRSAKKVSEMIDKNFCEVEWLELFPKGVVFEGSHFVLILENEEKKAVLPLRFPVQAADLLGALNHQSLWKKSLGFFTSELFKHWNVEIQRCVFTGHDEKKPGVTKHRVKLFYTKDGKTQFAESALDQVLGLCMEAQLPFYATRDYIQKSQVLEQDHENFLQKQKWTEGGQRYLM